MSETETLIAVVGTLGGTVLGIAVSHFFDERGERNRLRRETALSPLQEKQSALKETYYAMVDLMLALAKAAAKQQEQAKLIETLDRADLCVTRATIWMMGSVNNLRRLMDAEAILQGSCMKALSPEGLSEREFNESVSNAFAKAASALGKELGIDVLESQLREFATKSSALRR